MGVRRFESRDALRNVIARSDFNSLIISEVNWDKALS